MWYSWVKDYLKICRNRMKWEKWHIQKGFNGGVHMGVTENSMLAPKRKARTNFQEIGQVFVLDYLIKYIFKKCAYYLLRVSFVSAQDSATDKVSKFAAPTPHWQGRFGLSFPIIRILSDFVNFLILLGCVVLQKGMKCILSAPVMFGFTWA